MFYSFFCVSLFDGFVNRMLCFHPNQILFCVNIDESVCLPVFEYIFSQKYPKNNLFSSLELFKFIDNFSISINVQKNVCVNV